MSVLDTKLYTLKEAAQKLGFSEAALRKWLRQGKIGAIRIGWQWRFTEANLSAFVKRVEANED